jgi:hypothetical protein
MLLGIAVITGYAVLAVALHVLVDADRLRATLAPKAATVLNRPVSIGDARIALLPRPSIHLEEVRVDNLADFDGPSLAFAERVRLDVSWLPLLIGRVNVHRLRIDEPRIYLAIDESGTSNFGDLLPGQDASPDFTYGSVSPGIDEVVLSDASLTYFDAPGARSFAIAGGSARARLSLDGNAAWRADIEAESDSLHARLATVTDEILTIEGPSATLTARGDFTWRSIDIENGSVSLAGESLTLTGRLAGLTGSRPTYDLQLTNDSLDARALAVAFPPAVRSEVLPHLEGELAVTFQVSGAHAPGELPVVRGSIALTDVGFRLGGSTMVDDVRGIVGVTPDAIVLDSLTGVFAEGPFELSGTVVRKSGALALRATAHPDLDALDRLGLVPEGTTLSGDASLDVTLAGRLDVLDSLIVTGRATLDGLQAKHARLGVPLYVPTGEIELTDRRLTWSELPVLVGRDQLVTSGSVDDVLALGNDETSTPRVDITVRGARLDLDAAFPPDADTIDVTYPRIAFAHLGGRRIADRTPADAMRAIGLSRPETLPFHGTVDVQVDTLDFRPYRLTAVSALVELTDSTVSVEAPAFTLWGGSARGSLRFGVGEEPLAAFTLALAVDSVSAEDFLSRTTPAADAVSGTLSLELEAAGELDRSLLPTGPSLTGHVRLSVVDGRVRGTGPNLILADFLESDGWADVGFERWDTEAELVSRRLEVRESELLSDQGHVVFGGTLHLDGSHDFALGLSIPPDRLETVSLRRTGIGQSVLDQLAAAGRPLDLGLRMSGALRAPVIEPDASNAAASAR